MTSSDLLIPIQKYFKTLETLGYIDPMETKWLLVAQFLIEVQENWSSMNMTSDDALVMQLMIQCVREHSCLLEFLELDSTCGTSNTYPDSTAWISIYDDETGTVYVNTGDDIVHCSCTYTNLSIVTLPELTEAFNEEFD